jgi:hypothetical protein
MAADRTDLAEPSNRGGIEHARRRPLRALLWLTVLALVAAVVAGLALMVGARAPLLAARAAAEEGRTALLSGDASQARDAFARSRSSFDEGKDRLGNPLTRLAALVPVLGRTPDSLAIGAEAGALVAHAGELVAGAVAGLPDGPAALAPRDGVIPLAPLRGLATPLDRASDLVARADEVLRDLPRAWVPGVVADPLNEMAAEVSTARGAARAAAAMVRSLPEFLGAEGERRYFVGAQNPAEARGTGGLIGEYSILTVEGGRLELSSFRDIGELENAEPSDVDPSSDAYRELYARYGASAEWLNVNMSPDVPSAATAVERLYEHVTGVQLDGTILADPQAFARLLEVSGPVDVPQTDVTLDAASVVPFMTNEAYSLFPDSTARKRVLGAVADQVLGRFLMGEATSDPAGSLRALTEAAGRGHLLFHSTDREVQSAFEEAGVAGELVDAPGDFLAVALNNAGGNKLDFYAGRTVRYAVTLLPDGRAHAALRLDLRNEAPSTGQPSYVIGPHPLTDAAPGESLLNAAVYRAPGSRLTAFRRDGKPEGVSLSGVEAAHPVTLHGVRIPSGGIQRLEYEWVLPDAWRRDGGEGTYRVTFQGQPTIRPTRLEVLVRAPEGTGIARASSGMRVAGLTASWRGEVGDLNTFEVELSRPLLDRLWHW